MSKKKDEGYEWFKAHVDCGSLTFRYRVKGLKLDGHQAHDEDVSEWSERDIKNLAHALFDIDPAQVEVEYL